jgi:hypothetical protein
MSHTKGPVSPFCRVTFLPIILIVVLSYACNSSATQDVRPQQSEIQAAEAVEIEKVWEERVKQLHEKLKSSNINKGSVGEEFDILAELLRSASTGVADAELDRILRRNKAYDQMAPYEQTFIQFHIDKYENENNREKLVYIIRSKSPRNVGYVSLELGITNGKKPENLIVLFDAYDKALDMQTRRQLLTILRSVFSDLGEQYANDDQFLAASKQWLLANQTMVKINPSYSPSAVDLQRRKFFLEQKIN